MILKLLDYKSRETSFEIGDLEDIATIVIRVVTGDEIARIIYKDYTLKEYDSITPEDARICDCYDGGYWVYDPSKEINLFNNQEFMNRKSSYQILDKIYFD